MFLQPLAEGCIHAALPAFAGRFEGVQHVDVEADRCRFFRCGPRRSAAQGFFAALRNFSLETILSPTLGVALVKKSSVNSGASSGSIQELDDFLFFAVIGIPHRNNAAGGAAWSPD